MGGGLVWDVSVGATTESHEAIFWLGESTAERLVDPQPARRALRRSRLFRARCCVELHRVSLRQGFSIVLPVLIRRHPDGWPDPRGCVDAAYCRDADAKRAAGMKMGRIFIHAGAGKARHVDCYDIPAAAPFDHSPVSAYTFP